MTLIANPPMIVAAAGAAWHSSVLVAAGPC